MFVYISFDLHPIFHELFTLTANSSPFSEPCLFHYLLICKTQFYCFVARLPLALEIKLTKITTHGA